MSIAAITDAPSRVSDDALLVGYKLLRAAWLAALLGIALELLLLGLRSLLGSQAGGVAFVADLAQKVSWSVIVCIAIAAGTTAGRAVRPLLAGFAGLLASPLAFAAAKGMHKALTTSLGLELPDTEHALPSPWVIALIKGSEFAVLGVLLGWLSAQSDASLRKYLLSGAVVGTVFGALLVVYTHRATIPHPGLQAVVPQAINELIYPLGCSCVIYCSSRLGSRLAPASG